MAAAANTRECRTATRANQATLVKSSSTCAMKADPSVKIFFSLKLCLTTVAFSELIDLYWKWDSTWKTWTWYMDVEGCGGGVEVEYLPTETKVSGSHCCKCFSASAFRYTYLGRRAFLFFSIFHFRLAQFVHINFHTSSPSYPLSCSSVFQPLMFTQTGFLVGAWQPSMLDYWCCWSQSKAHSEHRMNNIAIAPF